MKEIDINSWNRREHFEFFSTFDEPFFGVVTEVDCTRAYKKSKENNWSFFAYYLYQSLKAINQIEEFRCRILDGKPVIYDSIHASPTIGREDGTFGFSFVEYSPDFEVFCENLNKEIKATQNSSGLRLTDDAMRQDSIHYSSVPWIKISGLTHARHFKFADSVPKISFGKMILQGGKRRMSVSVNVHHGLMDGLHVAEYLDLFQELLNE